MPSLPTAPRRLLRCLGLAVLCLCLPSAGGALEVVDIAGRKVSLERPAKRVLLGEGRFLVAISLLAPDDPLARVAGVLNEFRMYDPAGFAAYAEVFPEIDTLPIFGQASEASVSLEKAILLKPDAAFFGLSGHGPRETSKMLIRRLEDAGIPVVFIDFRDDPLANTAKSMRILGRVLGLDDEGERFAAFHQREVTKVLQRSAALEGPQPRVLLEARVGLGDPCCFTIAKGMFASLIEAAGGNNIAQGRLPGATGVLDLEYVLSADPDVYLGTAVGSLRDGPPASGRIVLGVGVAAEDARASLAAALDRPGFAMLAAVRRKRAYGLWHHVYNSPLNVYALQRIAKWLHPTTFRDIDPEATLTDLLARLRPVDLSGTYAVGLGAEAEE